LHPHRFSQALPGILFVSKPGTGLRRINHRVPSLVGV